MHSAAYRPLSVLCLLLFIGPFATAAKRPITVADMDQWRSIQNQQLSRDGRWLAYALFPQEGDGEFIVRNLQTGAEFKANAGARPPSQPPADDPEGRPEPRNLVIRFTQNLKHVVFTTFPTQQEMKKEKANAKGGLGIIALDTGAVTSIPAVRSMQAPEKGDGLIAYLKDDGPRPTGAAVRSREIEYGATLVIRNLASGAERNLPHVLEFSLTKNGKTLAYAVRSRSSEETNGVYLLDPSTPDSRPTTVIAGKGKYSNLAWNENQTQFAFIGVLADVSKLYVSPYDGGGKLFEAGPKGPWPDRFSIDDRAALTFSKDGERLFFSTAPKMSRTSNRMPTEDAVNVDLWHWRDDRIQPMQKVRANSDRNRTYRAVLYLKENRLLQLAEPAMPDLVLSDDGRWAIGVDDHEYRPMAEYDQRYTDSYLVNTRTGERKLLAKKHTGSVSWSPDSRHALLFNGSDWLALSVPDAKTINLTAKLRVKFASEDYDANGTPPSYGTAGWTNDGKYILLYDRFDIWRVTPDGETADNVTDGLGRAQDLQLRVVRRNPEDRWVDPAQPLLLRAEHLHTRDTGFYRDRLGAKAMPEKILMAARGFEPPVKAKDANVFLLYAHTYQEPADLLVTDDTFRELKKVTNANPQQADLLWGSAELIKYRNVDGVPLSGILFKPENFDPSKKYPMVVYLYERLSQTFHTFREPRPANTISVPMYTSNGYLVLCPDIVYRIGSPGASALKSVLPAVQAVVDRGIVNEKAIGIQGHSWGGYQIAYMLTETNRFRAAAAGAVVANMTSAYNGIRYGPGIPRQFQYERAQSRIGGSLWEYPMRFLENSPVFKADRIQTPLLMMHNDADDAVPFTQGVEFYLALRRLGKEAYMFNYNGEPHNLRKRPNQKDYTTRMFEYFNYYLKDGPKPAWMERGIPYLERDSYRTSTETSSDVRP